MRISAKADYAIRAVVELASMCAAHPVKAETLAAAQGIPAKYLLNVLFELKRAGIVTSQRGAVGGYRLGRPPAQITLADIIRAVEGPLAQVGDYRPDELDYHGTAEPLRDVWVAVRANLRSILETVTVAHVANRTLPAKVHRLTAKDDAWLPHIATLVPDAMRERAATDAARNQR